MVLVLVLIVALTFATVFALFEWANRRHERARFTGTSPLSPAALRRIYETEHRR